LKGTTFVLFAHILCHLFFYSLRDVTKPFDEPPLFYQGADEYTGDKLAKVSDEVMELKRVLLQRYPGLHLDALHHVSEWMIRSYGDDIGDKTNIYTMLRTNKGYRGLTHPMIEVEVDGQKKFKPNFKYRYFTEDIPVSIAALYLLLFLLIVHTFVHTLTHICLQLTIISYLFIS